MKLEGSGASQMVQVIRNFSKSSPFEMRLGTVISPVPEIQIQLDGTKLVLDKDFLLVCSSIADTLKADDRVLVSALEDGNTFVIIDKVVSYA